jgi:branched-chain amino acid transport system ATP-binding protein
MSTLSPNGSGKPLLELEAVSSAYGPFRAIFDVSFVVPEGAVVALLGPNGAGKSTVARVSTGLVPVTSGHIRFDGREVTGLPAWRMARLGIAHAPEGRSVFSSLTVEENLVLPFRQALGKKGVPAALERAYSHFPRLGERRKQSAGTLSGGEQRMLSLARVLAEPPRLLVVDELSLGLAPIVVDEVFSTLRKIKDEGTSLLVVEQHVGRALEIADHAVLLSQGRVLHHGRVDELGEAIEKLLPGTPA